MGLREQEKGPLVTRVAAALCGSKVVLLDLNALIAQAISNSALTNSATATLSLKEDSAVSNDGGVSGSYLLRK